MAEGLTFGGIGVSNNTVAETTTDATARAITAFNINGEYNRVTCEAASGIITIQEAGTYQCLGHVSFSGTLSKTFYVGVFKNGTSEEGIPCERKLGTGGDVGAASFCANIALQVGDTLGVFHRSDDGGISFTGHQLALSVLRVK